MKRTIWAISIFFTINGFSQNKTPGDTTYIDTIIFENLCNYLSIDTSAQNIWEIGTPSQYFLDSAYTFDKAIMTDTNDFYPINNVSYFDLIFDFGQFPFYYHQYNSWGLSFKHKFDTDTLKDGDFITVSFDNRSSWYNIIEYIDQVYYGDLILCTFPSPNENGLYGFLDTLTQGQYGFSGRSDGWNTAAFLWEVCVVKGEKSVSDTMIVLYKIIIEVSSLLHANLVINNCKKQQIDYKYKSSDYYYRGLDTNNEINGIFTLKKNENYGYRKIDYIKTICRNITKNFSSNF